MVVVKEYNWTFFTDSCLGYKVIHLFKWIVLEAVDIWGSNLLLLKTNEDKSILEEQ